MKIVFVIPAALLLCAPPARAHGITCQSVVETDVFVYHCSYESGDVVNGASVGIFAPGDAVGPFLELRTDRNGIFAFVPDVAGTWRAVVDDGLGHRAEWTLIRSGDHTPMENPEGHTHARSDVQDIPLAYKVFFGLSLIWGATGFWYGFRARSARGASRTP